MLEVLDLLVQRLIVDFRGGLALVDSGRRYARFSRRGSILLLGLADFVFENTDLILQLEPLRLGLVEFAFVQ